MKKEKKLPRVNVIRNKYDEKDIIETWGPVLQKSLGIERKMDGYHDALARYCHVHTINESAMQAHVNAPVYSNPDYGTFAKFMPPPTITPSTLPLALGILNGIDGIENMRIEVVEVPAYILLIDDKKYFDEIDSVDGVFQIPATTAVEANTNLIDIYQERMVDHFINEISKYIDSVPNADTLIIYNLGELFMVNDMDGTLEPKNTMRMRFRIKAFEDATYMPKREEKVSVDIEEIGPEPEAEFNFDVPEAWIMRLDKEPSRFKKWIAAVFFGRTFQKMKTKIFYKDYWM